MVLAANYAAPAWLVKRVFTPDFMIEIENFSPEMLNLAEKFAEKPIVSENVEQTFRQKTSLKYKAIFYVNVRKHFIAGIRHILNKCPLEKDGFLEALRFLSPINMKDSRSIADITAVARKIVIGASSDVAQSEWLLLRTENGPHEPVSLFFEDEVCRVTKNKEIQYGMVVETAEYSSDDESADEDDMMVQKGFVKVAWYPKGEEEIIKADKLQLTDRSLMPGDVVSSLERGLDKVGYCKSIDVTTSLRIFGFDEVILNVRSEDLVPILEWAENIAVYYEGWIGVIREVNIAITARSEQKVSYRMDQKMASHFKDVTDKRKSTCEFRRVHYYPGQILVGPVQALDFAEVLEGEHKTSNGASLKKKKLKLLVEEVSVRSLILKWNCQAHTKTESGSGNALGMGELPPVEIQGDEVKKVRPLEIFRAATLQLGDRSFYVWKGDEKTMTSEEWKKIEVSRLTPCISKNKKLSAANLRCDEYERQKSQLEVAVFLDFEEAYDNVNHQILLAKLASLGLYPKLVSLIKIFQRKSKFHCWYDTNISDLDHYEDVVSDDEVGPVNGTSGHNKDKRKGRSRKANVSFATRQNRMKKLRRSKSKGQNTLESAIPKVGERLVVDSIGTESRVTVMWQDGTVETNLPSRSLLPIQYLDDQEFFPGDFVVENKEDTVGLENDDLLVPHGKHDYGCVKRTYRADRTVTVSWFKLNFDCDNKSEFCCEREMSSYEVKSHPDYDYRPGSCVIRIAGDPSDDPFNKAGQVVDYLTNGKVFVWWVNGSTEEVEPQDLYKVGDYETGSDGLWNDSSLSQLDALDELLSRCPFRLDTSTLECATTNLVNIYKICRSCDGLISTNYFDITKFEHLIKKMNSKKLDLVSQNLAFDSALNFDILELLNDINALECHTSQLCYIFFSDYSSFKAILSLILYVCKKDSIPSLPIQFSQDLAIDVSFLKKCFDEPIVKGLEALFLKASEIKEVSEQKGRCLNISEITKILMDDPDLLSFVEEYFNISDGKLEIKPSKVFGLASYFFHISAVDWLRFRKIIKKCCKKFISTSDDTHLYMVLFLATAVEYSALKTGIRQAGFSAREFLEKLPCLTWRQTSFLSKELKKVANCIYQWKIMPDEEKIDLQTYCVEFMKLLKTQLRELLDSVLSQTPNQNEQPLNVAAKVASLDVDYSGLSPPPYLDPPPYLNTVVTKEDFGMSLAAKKTSATLQQTAVEGEDPPPYLNTVVTKEDFGMSLAAKKTSATLQQTAVEGEDPPPYLNTVVTKEDFGMSLAAKKTSPTLQQTAVEGEEGYVSLETAPESHRYYSNIIKPENPNSFLRAYREEVKLLSKSLPEGIHVRSFQDRT
ncbi:hypothetical protein QYM36_008527, partial [Artemia franciscana]